MPKEMRFPLNLQMFAEGSGGTDGGAAGSGAGDPGTMVPKYRLDEALQRAHNAEAEVVRLNNENADLKKQVEGVKAKDDEIANLKKQITDKENEFKAKDRQAKVDKAIEDAIKDKAVDPAVVRKMIDEGKIEINEKGEVKGLNEQIESLQKDHAFLWKPAQQSANTGAAGGKTSEESFATKLGKEAAARNAVAKEQDTYFK